MAAYPELNGKIAVISGAGGNLGIATIKRLAGEGVHMALIDRREEGLRARLREAGVDDSPILVGPVDLLDRPGVEGFIARVVEQLGQVDILINIAGGFKGGGPVHEMDEALWDELMNLNAKTAFILSAAAARSMVKAGRRGRIVNVGARAGLTGIPGIAPYSASKSALLRLTESMAGELLQHGITVNAVLPSTIDTPQNRKNDPNADFTKWVAPESLADVIAFLVSDSSRDITGALIPVYGRA